MNAKRFTLLIACFILIGIMATSRSGGPATILGTGYTGAPSESTCGSCHSGGNYGTVTPTIQMFAVGGSTPLTAYAPGTQYDMKVTVNHSAGTPSRYGFQMTALRVTGSTALAGYSNLAAGITQATAGGRTYVEHNTPSVSNQFTFRWTAPASGTGSVRFYASGNCVNNNGGSNGDTPGSASVTVTEMIALAVTGTKTDVTCFGLNNGTINITASGGTPTYSYMWSDGPTTEDRTGLAPGTYSVTVTDAASGIVTSSNFVITQPAAPLNIGIVFQNVNCQEQVLVSATGGTAPYTGTGTQNITGGLHTYTVIDAKGCTKDTTFTYIALSPLVASAVANGQVPCNGNGTTVTVSATGGNGVYTGTGIFPVTSAGVAQFTVTDGNNCSSTASVTVQSVSGLSVVTDLTMPGCTDTCAGAIVTTVQTGSATFTESLVTSPGNIPVANFTGLCPGSYLYEVVDGDGCEFNEVLTIESPEHPTVTVTQVTQANGGSNGGIDVSISGGQVPYTYEWSNGTTTEDVSNIPAGIYTIIVTGDNDCETESEEIEVFDIAGLEEAQALGLSVYPNPFNGSFQLSDANWKVVNVRDISGKKITYQQTGQNVQIQNPLPGVYIIQIKRDDQTIILRMVSE